MKKIIKFIKNNIFGFIIGGVIFGTIGVGAATMFLSSEVAYDNTYSGSSATTVSDALDELYEKSLKFSTISVGRAVYFNPVTLEKCLISDYNKQNSLSENNKGCMKWYIIDSKSSLTTVDLILDHNTTKDVAWTDTLLTTNGPTTALTQLKSDTDAWHSSLSRSDIYTDPAEGYTINYSGYKARLITANEIASITGADEILYFDSGNPYGILINQTSAAWYYLNGSGTTYDDWRVLNQSENDYAWLFNYTENCTDYGCQIADSGTTGYWTSSARNYVDDPEDAVWVISNAGLIGIDELGIATSPRGIRPVITISKDIIS